MTEESPVLAPGSSSLLQSASSSPLHPETPPISREQDLLSSVSADPPSQPVIISKQVSLMVALASEGGREVSRTVLYVGDIPKSALELEIKNLTGPAISIKMLHDKNKPGFNYAFVEYEDHQTALDILEKITSDVAAAEIQGATVKANWAYQLVAQTEEYQQVHLIFVGDLSVEVDDEALLKAFSKFSSLQLAHVMWDMQTSRLRGYGFVQFGQLEDAEAALKSMNGAKIGNRNVRCNWASHRQMTKRKGSKNYNIPLNNSISYRNGGDPNVPVGVMMAPPGPGSLGLPPAPQGSSKFPPQGPQGGGGHRGISTVPNGQIPAGPPINTTMPIPYVPYTGANPMMGPGRPQLIPYVAAAPDSILGGDVKSVLIPTENLPHQVSYPSPDEDHIIQINGPHNPNAAQHNAAGAIMMPPQQRYEMVLHQTSTWQTTVYLGNIAHFTQLQDLIPLLQNFGLILDFKFHPERGCAFVKYDSHERAALAIVQLFGFVVNGRPLKCGWGKEKPLPPKGQYITKGNFLGYRPYR